MLPAEEAALPFEPSLGELIAFVEDATGRDVPDNILLHSLDAELAGELLAPQQAQPNPSPLENVLDAVDLLGNEGPKGESSICGLRGMHIVDDSGTPVILVRRGSEIDPLAVASTIVHELTHVALDDLYEPAGSDAAALFQKELLPYMLEYAWLDGRRADSITEPEGCDSPGSVAATRAIRAASEPRGLAWSRAVAQIDDGAVPVRDVVDAMTNVRIESAAWVASAGWEPGLEAPSEYSQPFADVFAAKAALEAYAGLSLTEVLIGHFLYDTFERESSGSFRWELCFSREAGESLDVAADRIEVAGFGAERSECGIVISGGE